MNTYKFTISYNDREGKIRNNVLREIEARDLTEAYEQVKADIADEGGTGLRFRGCVEEKRK